MLFFPASPFVHQFRPVACLAKSLCSTFVACLLLVMAAGCASGDIERDATGETTGEWTPPDGPPDGSPVALHGQLRVEGLQIVDEAGNPYQLKGISTQWLNFEGSFSRNLEGLEFMRDQWNVQVIRGAMGVEQAAGYLTSQESMTNAIERVIQNAIDLGVYVIVDWHDHNAIEHQLEASAFFSSMAAKWGDYPNILWETFNEPIGDEWPALKTYHEFILERIREHDDNNIVILGTRQWSQLPNEAAADPIVGDPNVMYTLHFYSCTHDNGIRSNAQQALDMGAPVFVTEWGATNADGGLPGPNGEPAEVCDAEADAWHDWMDSNGISWAAWKYDSCIDASCFFKDGTPFNGGWTAENLNGHGPYVLNKLLQ